MERFNRNGRKGVLHYLTFNIRDRRQVFRSDLYLRAVCQVLRRHCDEHPAKLVSYVVMPEHMHIVTNPQDGDINLFLSQLKPAITLRVAEIAHEYGHDKLLSWLYDPYLQRYHLWQDGKYNFHLYSERLIWQKINYIHSNPIARKLVRTAADYSYSSFRAMYGIDAEIIIPIDQDFWWEEDGLVLDDEEIV